MDREHLEEFKELIDTNYCGGECQFLVVKSSGSLKAISFEMRNYLLDKNIYPASAFKLKQERVVGKPSQRFISMYLSDETLANFSSTKKNLSHKKRKHKKKEKNMNLKSEYKNVHC